MAATDVKLQHADVNSGTAVEMNISTVSYSWKNTTKTEPAAGQFDTVESEYAGFENPVILTTSLLPKSIKEVCFFFFDIMLPCFLCSNSV